MDQTLVQEFDNQYQEDCAPRLPEELKDYRFLSCLQDQPQRKIWLLSSPSGLRKVLVKYAAGEYVAMLRNEKNIVKYESTCGKFPFFPYVIDYFETEGDEAYLLREYIEGDTLQELVEKSGPLPPKEARSVIQKLCQCLARLHQADPPIIYRDLKPANVVLTAGGECFLIDAGTLRSFRAGSRQDTELMGSAATAAPEQYGARQTDERTDIYSLGMLYAYLLTGDLDADGKTPMPAREAKIIKKATSFDPDNRYRSVEEFTDALMGFKPRLKKRGILAVAAAALLVCVLCFLFLPHLALPARQVTFESALLRQAVTAALGKSEQDSVYYRDLDEITRLFVCGSTVFDDYDTHYADPYRHSVNGEDVSSSGTIQNIALLARMPNLTELVLDNQGITNLAPLEGLPLTRLSLCGNPIADLKPLAGCDTLRELYLGNTDVSDLAPLASCDSLEKLGINATKVTDLSPLKGFSLTWLDISDLTLADYRILATMPIEELICKKLPKAAFSDAAKIATLKRIVLYECGITSLDEVLMFSQLETLDVCSNQLTDLDGLKAFPALRILCISGNPIRDFSGIREADTIQSLDMLDTGNCDFSFLNDLPSLNHIWISENQADNLYQAVPEPDFEVQID